MTDNNVQPLGKATAEHFTSNMFTVLSGAASLSNTKTNNNPDKYQQTDEAIKALLRAGTLRSIRKSAIITRPDLDQATIQYIVSGSATQSLMNADGNEIILAYLGAGNFLGELGMFTHEGSNDIWARAQTDVKYVEISFSRFDDLCQTHPILRELLQLQIADNLVNTRRRLYDTVSLSIHEKVRNVLNCLASQPSSKTVPDGIEVKVTRVEISRIIGCSREMVGRAYKDLHEMGYIHMHGNARKVTVLNNPVVKNTHLEKSDSSNRAHV